MTGNSQVQPNGTPARSTGHFAPAAPAEPGEAILVNLTQQGWTLHRSYGTFQVRGCAKGEPYSLTRVAGRTAVMDLGDKRSLEVPIHAVEVARDLAREINSDGGEDSYFGVFIAAGDEPGEDELAAARARLETFYRRLVGAADREWERSHSYLFISDLDRRAAGYLGLEKEWFYQAQEKQDCPGCGEKLKLGVAVCKTCGVVLDREKAARLGLSFAIKRSPLSPAS
jgi:hypothetical protein